MQIFRTLAPTAVLAFILLYFLFHAIQGDRGVLAYSRLSQELERKQVEIEMLEAEIAAMQQKVTGLKPSSLDLDLLEEQVRRVLNYSHRNEAIFIVN